MTYESMKLKILLPFGVFSTQTGVKRIVAETGQGAFGLLPNRLDCVAALVPGIFFYENAQAEEVYVAIDQGVLVKAGEEVLVSVRNAIGGLELGKLHKAVNEQFLQLSEREEDVKSLMVKLETRFVRQFHKLHQE